MQRSDELQPDSDERRKRTAEPQGGCYGVQVLVAGRRKPWRDAISMEVRQAGFCATSVDSAVDALTVLALGLPVDVMIADQDLHGDLCCSQLAVEARSLRPELQIVLATDLADDEEDLLPGAFVLPQGGLGRGVASTLRDALAARA